MDGCVGGNTGRATPALAEVDQKDPQYANLEPGKCG